MADSVRLRTFPEEQPVAVSPDGKRVAYVLIEPDLKENYNQTVVYMHELPKTAAERSAAQARKDRAADPGHSPDAMACGRAAAPGAAPSRW